MDRVKYNQDCDRHAARVHRKLKRLLAQMRAMGEADMGLLSHTLAGKFHSAEHRIAQIVDALEGKG